MEETLQQMSDPDVSMADGLERPDLIRRVSNDDLRTLIEKEWLVTNGLGGYASGTIAGASTRRYHGLLIGAHPAPRGRIMHLSHLGERFGVAELEPDLFGVVEQVDRGLELNNLESFEEFRLELGLPVWRFKVNGVVIEKRIYMPHRQNTVHVNYRIVEGIGPLPVNLRVSVHFRGHDWDVSSANPAPYVLTACDGRIEVVDQGNLFPPLRLRIQGKSTSFVLDEMSLPDILYRVEAGRGYDSVGRMFSPGLFRAMLSRTADVTLIASTESWERIQALPPQEALSAEVYRRVRLIETANLSVSDEPTTSLILAADQFIISPASRLEDSARADAAGDQARTIIAGYHWFTDWGRDSMISLEGLTLCTGRHAEAAYILRTFINHVRDGLIPNFFPDGSTEGVYHTADATLWFFHALHRYMEVTGDQGIMRQHLATLKDIVAHHQRGTRFGIGVDPRDGLLKQGAEGYQLTWMDAKVGDWVVTPRRGKAVEINALWYNALRLMEKWMIECGEDAQPVGEAAQKAYESFNRKFWCEDQKGLYDVVDGENGDDNSCRPNQLFSLSLPYPILEEKRWPQVLKTVQDRLLTPFGLRTLAPGNPDYKQQYCGDLRARDAAYHQGTVWAWLIGPFVDAWMRVYPERISECRSILSGFRAHLNEACVGTISEIFDAEAPYTPRGCVAQAWSVAEVLRVSVLVGVEPEDPK
jgi:predicted glycogen debranching enzyme